MSSDIAKYTLAKQTPSIMHTFKPTQDITAWELAKNLEGILNATQMTFDGSILDTLPEQCKRHFRSLESK